MECTVHIGGARLITIRQLASLVQLFLLKAEDFSLAFLFSSTSTYRISRSQPYRVCQTWLLEGAAGTKAKTRAKKEPPTLASPSSKSTPPPRRKAQSLKSYCLSLCVLSLSSPL